MSNLSSLMCAIKIPTHTTGGKSDCFLSGYSCNKNVEGESIFVLFRMRESWGCYVWSPNFSSLTYKINVTHRSLRCLWRNFVFPPPSLKSVGSFNLSSSFPSFPPSTQLEPVVAICRCCFVNAGSDCTLYFHFVFHAHSYRVHHSFSRKYKDCSVSIWDG